MTFIQHRLKEKLALAEERKKEERRAELEKDKPWVPFKYDPKEHTFSFPHSLSDALEWYEKEWNYTHNRYHQCNETCNHKKKEDVIVEVDPEPFMYSSVEGSDRTILESILNSPVASTSKKAKAPRKNGPKKPKKTGPKKPKKTGTKKENKSRPTKPKENGPKKPRKSDEKKAPKKKNNYNQH